MVFFYRYWVEQGAKFFPKNQSVKRLKVKMTDASSAGVSAATSAMTSAETSPKNDEEDGGNLWSTTSQGASFLANANGSTLGGRFTDLNASLATSTPNRSTSNGGSLDQRARFAPRPSPERLQSQMKTQERAIAALQEQQATLLETNDAVLNEVRKNREAIREELSKNQGEVKRIVEETLRVESLKSKYELRDEISKGNAGLERRLQDFKTEMEFLRMELKNLKTGSRADAEDKSAAAKPLMKSELQEALENQAAMIQMQNLGLVGMLAQARPPLPSLLGHPAGVALPTQPTAVPWQRPAVPAVSPAPAAVIPKPAAAQTPTNVVITTSDKVPTTASPLQALMSVTVPPQHRLGVSPQHGFQMQPPKGAPAVTASPFAGQDGPAVPLTTTALLSSIPAPTYSAVAQTSPEKSTGLSFAFGGGRQRQTSVSSVKSGGSHYEDDPEHDPCPDFKPVIPLPEEVETVTGEEEEDVVFEERCKLLRFVDKEWKERGLGQLKILKHKVSGKSRILMRREQTLKICANHFILSDIKMEKMKNLDKACTWAANDFADEEPKVETFCSRFKTAEQADDFLAKFKAAQQEAKAAPTPVKKNEPEKVENLGSLAQFKPKAGSWECQGCFCRNNGDVIQCPACQTAKPGHEDEVKAKEQAAKPAVSFGAGGGIQFGASSTPSSGFTFGASNPAPATSGGFVFGGGAPAAAKPVEEKKEEAKPSPFAGFSFFSGNASSGVQDLTDDGSTELSFDGQGLKLNSEADAKDVVAQIKAKKTMETLTFSGNTIGIEAAKAIGQALETHGEFKYARWKDMFTGRMKTEIPPALKHLGRGIMTAHAKLVEIDLSDNAFGPIGMEGIVDLLKSPSCFTLKVLKLHNTGCGVTGGKKLAETLIETYHASKAAGTPLGLTTFVLGRSRQENEGAKALAKIFKMMGTLQEVVMPQNGIYHEGIQALADAFACNPHLETLNMNDNTLTEKGAKHLAEALPKLQKLKVLNLGDCLLKTKGAQWIAEALKEGHTDLEELHMDSNEIKLSGGQCVVEAVADKPKLTKLALDCNQFGEAGCEEICQLLEAAGKSDVMEEFSEDEEPDEDDEEEEEPNVETVKSAASIFGGGNASANNTSIFGNQTEKSSIFGGSPANASTLFGGNASNHASPSIFGGTTTSPSIFGGHSADASAASGANATPLGTKKGGLFGQANASSTFSFGSTSTSAGQGTDLSASKDLPSFSALASTGGSNGLATKTEGFTFAGAGSAVFSSKPRTAAKDDGDDDTVEENEHDPHFEPIIPLPELVQVKTGEEEEETLFKHRAKVYRYATETKEWKERGVGDIKILKHPDRQTYRVLLRREQIHKIACNHLISTEMQLQPLCNSETAVCWFAMDYAEEEPKMEQLAVRFKTKETNDEFKKVFEDCQSKLKEKGSPSKEDATKNEEKTTPVSSSNSTSLFGKTDVKKEDSPPKSLFGAATTTATTSLFGATTTAAPSLFGAPATTTSTATTSLFGAATTATTSLFGKPASTTSSIFGGTSTPAATTFSFGSPSTGLFGKPAASSTAEEGGDEDEHEEDDHDPHFEPIIPLPELVNVQTGEEEEEALFTHRAKVFRYDVETKQWKERGIGDLKILKHAARKTYRVLLRREQIHKVACNHFITTEMEPKSLAG